MKEGNDVDWIVHEEMYPDVLLKITIALALSLIIGIERELKKKPIGLKTSAVIATFSCLLTIVSIESAYMFPGSTEIGIRMDPLRLPAQIVSGIGFLGAGAILRRDNDNITGITTAAMIWGAASIGITVGAGFYIEALFTVVSVMIVIEGLAPFLSRFGPRRIRSRELPCTIIIIDKSKIEDLLNHLKDNKMTIKRFRIRQIVTDDESDKHELEFRLSTTSKKPTSKVYDELTSLPYIESVELEILT